MSKLELLLLGIGSLGTGVVVLLLGVYFSRRQKQGLNPKNLFLSAISGLVAMFIMMQFSPFIFPALQTSNPSVTYAVQWDSPATKALWDRACNDCHSNETIWPWYSHIAPISWLVTYDVDEGRSKLNVSEGHKLEGHEMIEQIERDKMPMAIYIVMHPDAKLSDAEKEQLIAGLRATFRG